MANTSARFGDPVQRTQLVEVARSWIGTPFHPHGRNKGPRGGCSCQSLAISIYTEAGHLPEFREMPKGPLNWSRAHKDSMIVPYVEGELTGFFEAVEGEPPQIGDLLGFEVGACVHHLGIMIDGNKFVHVLKGQGTTAASIDDPTYMRRLAKVWRPVKQ